MAHGIQRAFCKLLAQSDLERKITPNTPFHGGVRALKCPSCSPSMTLRPEGEGENDGGSLSPSPPLPLSPSPSLPLDVEADILSLGLGLEWA